MSDFDARAFWAERWAEGRTAFHREEVHPALLGEAGRFLGEEPQRVLVPLCGKALDVPWLAEQGHAVVGVEIVRQAVETLFAEHGLVTEIETRGDHDVYRAGPLQVWCGDFFGLPESVGPFTRVWDRAALVAVPPDRRSDYVATLLRLAPGALLWLVSIDYDAGALGGPPFAVSDDEVRTRFADAAPVRLSSRNLALDPTTRWARIGLSRFDVTAWSMVLPDR